MLCILSIRPSVLGGVYVVLCVIPLSSLLVCASIHAHFRFYILFCSEYQIYFRIFEIHCTMNEYFNILVFLCRNYCARQWKLIELNLNEYWWCCNTFFYNEKLQKQLIISQSINHFSSSPAQFECLLCVVLFFIHPLFSFVSI